MHMAQERSSWRSLLMDPSTEPAARNRSFAQDGGPPAAVTDLVALYKALGGGCSGW
jgi:hypothetical protein